VSSLKSLTSAGKMLRTDFRTDWTGPSVQLAATLQDARPRSIRPRFQGVCTPT
jgi:hypothetical protein